MRGPVRNALRLLTRVMRPLALRSAGQEGSGTSVVRHVGRRSGRAYETPVIAVQHGDSFLIALPYGERTDWLKNVLDKGSAVIVTNGHAYEVDRPEVIPMAEATAYFRPREQRMHRQFHVDAALQVHRRLEAHGLQGPRGDIHIGIAAFAADGHARVAELARAADEAGLESLFVVQYTHLAAGRRDLLKQSGEEGILSPARRVGIPGPFVALGAAAAVTRRLGLGTGACYPAVYDPVLLARQVTTLDQISGAGSCSASPQAGIACCSAITAKRMCGRVASLLAVPSGKMAVMIASRLWVRVVARHDDRGTHPPGRSPSGRPARSGGQRTGAAARSDCLGWR